VVACADAPGAGLDEQLAADDRGENAGEEHGGDHDTIAA